jgi:hypothetical protein
MRRGSVTRDTVGGYSCAYGGGSGCSERANDPLHQFNPVVMDILRCWPMEVGRLCDVHRRIAVCSVCQNAYDAFNLLPQKLARDQGRDFNLPAQVRPMLASHYDVLAAARIPCRARPGDKDQFHPSLEALICRACRGIVTTKKKARQDRIDGAAARAAAESARAAAARLAEAPQRKATPAVKQRRITRTAKTAASAPPEARSARLRPKVRPPPPPAPPPPARTTCAPV